MKVALISPTWEKFPRWSYHLPQLAPLTIAGLTPPDWDVVFIDEFVEPIDAGLDADLVAITAMTAQAQRAYEIADTFRRRGRPVVLGGVHPTLLPEEAAAHADAVVVGEAEPLWEGLLRDVERGCLRPRYDASEVVGSFCVAGKFPRRDLLGVEGYSLTFDGSRAIETIQTTRGCVFDCDFCNVPMLYGRRLRSRPIADVMAELATVEAKNVFIVDNLVYENKKYFLRLMKELARVDAKWISVGSLKMARDRAFVEAMADSGCAFVYVGFDHLFENTYDQLRKLRLPGHYREDMKIHDVDFTQDHLRLTQEYRAAVRVLQDAGIGVFGTFAFGFDGDDESVFERTVDFALDADLALADFAILTPYPQSPLRRRLEEEGRIVDRSWAHYNGCHVVFEPLQMDAATLAAGWAWAWDRFYEEKSVLRRLCEAFLPKPSRRGRRARRVQSRDGMSREAGLGVATAWD